MLSQGAARTAARWTIGAGRFSLLLALLALTGLSSAAVANHNTTELVSTGPAGGTPSLASNFGGISDDGSRVFFWTAEALVPEDADGILFDVYERSGGQTTLLSRPSGVSETPGNFGAFFGAATADGSRVFFETDDALVAEDMDGTFYDVYERSGGTTKLISPSGNAAFDASFDGISNSGDRVFFSTAEPLAGDTDTQLDIYGRSSGGTTLISSGGNGTFDPTFAGASADGTRVAFTTDESLNAADTDGRTDIYQHSSGATTLVSTGPAGGNGALDASFGAISDDGTRIIFDTQETLVADDGDGGFHDVYERSFGASPSTALLSESTAGPDGPFDAFFVGASDDGARVFFDTDEDLTPGTSDLGGLDVYVRYGSATLNVSGGTGPFDARFLASTSDGLEVFFDTAESLAAGDGDGLRDVYSRSGLAGLATLVSGGGSEPVEVCMVPSSAVSCGIFFSADGSRVFINTDAALLPGDADGDFDIYERTGGVTTMVTASGALLPAILRAVASDGSLVFFESQEALAGDADGTVRDVFSSRFVQPPPPVTPSSPPPATGGQGGSVVSLTATMSAAKTQRVLLQGGVVVIVVCNKRCQASATGSINVPGASKVFRLKPTKRSVRPNKKTQLRLKLTQKARKAISRALKRKKKLRAKVSLTVDSAGEKRSRKLTVKLKR